MASMKNLHAEINGGHVALRIKNGPMENGKLKTRKHGRRTVVFRFKQFKMFVLLVGFMGCFCLLAAIMLSAVHHVKFEEGLIARNFVDLQNIKQGLFRTKRAEHIMYGRLLNLSSAAIAENDSQGDNFAPWDEPHKEANQWRPCAEKHFANQDHVKNNTGFILVSANGGLNQQRVAICNAVAVAALLNATLVLPKFLYSSVWKDPSQFGDIYHEEYFVNYMKNDVHIVKDLPPHLRSLDFEAIGSQINETDMMKEAKPSYFIEVVLPLLLKNGVVHFLGFGNKLGFDPIPVHLQRLRCRCNFHALKFVPRIQEVGSLLVQRLRKHETMQTELDKQLFGNNMLDPGFRENDSLSTPAKYLALHLRFEVDMVAYSLCDFGGGEEERRELQAYREFHFPTLATRRESTPVSPHEQRMLGRCPLTPEEAALLLAALGYSSKTYVYIAGSQIYGGTSRLRPFTRLYPNMVTKHDLLTPAELAPFSKFSSQLAALDFIACASADVFAITDSGSQLSSLVSGFRIYHGRGHAPTILPNRKWYAQILAEEDNLEWTKFEKRVRKMISLYQRVTVRPKGRSIYRQPRTPGCMCSTEDDSVDY